MKKFQKIGNGKRALRLLLYLLYIVTPIKPHAAGIIAKLHGIGFAGGIAQAGADGGEQGVLRGTEDAVAAHGAEGHEGQAELAAE